MFFSLFEGDKVICSFLEPTLWETSIKDNFCYVIVTRGDILIKRIHNQIKGEKQLTLISDNNYYEPYPVSIGDVREIWYVRAKISPFLPSPQNLQNLMRDEVKELQNTIHHQSSLIEKLHQTIEKLL